MKKLTLTISLALLIAPVAFAEGLSNATLTGNNAGLSYTQGTNAMTINCNQAITNVEWQKLNVAANETLNFAFSKANSTAYNTVVGGSVSTIAGKINAIGAGADTSNIVLTNAAGVTFANGSILNVGQFTVRAMGAPVNLEGVNVEKGSLSILNPNGKVNITGNNYIGKNFTIAGSRTTNSTTGSSTIVATDDVNINNAVVNVPNGSFNIGLAKNINIVDSKINAKDNSQIWAWGGSVKLANSSVKLSDGTIKLVTTTATMKDSDIAIGNESKVRNIYMTNSNLKADKTTVTHSIRLGYDPETDKNADYDNSKLTMTNSSANIIALQSNGTSADLSATDITEHLYSVNGGNIKISNNSSNNILRLIHKNGNIEIADANIYSLLLENSMIDLSNVSHTFANIQLPTSLVGQNIALQTDNGITTTLNATDTDIKALDKDLANTLTDGKISRVTVKILPNTDNTLASASTSSLSLSGNNTNTTEIDSTTNVVDTLKVNTKNYQLNTSSDSIATQFLKNVRSLATDDNEKEQKKRAKLSKINNGFRIEEKITPIKNN